MRTSMNLGVWFIFGAEDRSGAKNLGFQKKKNHGQREQSVRVNYQPARGAPILIKVVRGAMPTGLEAVF
jgi:hypothetical protein